MEDIELLIALAQQPDTSTISLAKKVRQSQQTVSRKLISLEKKGFIRRAVSNRGIHLRLLPKSLSYLKGIAKKVDDLFGKRSVSGIVTSGMGEGGFYIKKYAKKIQNFLGFAPYPGTLNLRVDPADKAALTRSNPIIIPEFSTPERTYGAVYCYPVRIQGIIGAVIVPLRSTHPEDIVEVIAPAYLRGTLQLKDNAVVELETFI